MAVTTRRLVRLLAVTAFLAAVTGWAGGLLAIRDTGSGLALMLATSCGLGAVGSLAAWHAARPPA